jgi:hypothetical protein
MMKSRISATAAARNFSDILNRVRYRAETFVVERGGEPICEISPVRPPTVKGRDLVGVLDKLPRPDDEFFEIVREITRKQPRVAKSRWQP